MAGRSKGLYVPVHSPAWKGSGEGYVSRRSDFCGAALPSHRAQKPPLNSPPPALGVGTRCIHVPRARPQCHGLSLRTQETESGCVPEKRRHRNQRGVAQSATKRLLTFGDSSFVNLLITSSLLFFFSFGLPPSPNLYILTWLFFVYSRRYWFLVGFIPCKSFFQSAFLIASAAGLSSISNLIFM